MALSLNVATVPVMMLSVDATPVNPVPSPVNAVATTTPLTSSFSVIEYYQYQLGY